MCDVQHNRMNLLVHMLEPQHAQRLVKTYTESLPFGCVQSLS